MFAAYAAPSADVSEVNAAQDFFSLAPLLLVLQRQKNIKQKYFCEKQGKGRSCGLVVYPCVLQTRRATSSPGSRDFQEQLLS